MDPDATLARLLEAAAEGNADEVREAAEDLATWLERGGFPPKDPRSNEGRA
jgi:hypothetical protein